VAAEYTAVYPFASPGGWHILGRTEAKIFDPSSGAVLHLGDLVRFAPLP
jgi:allophanate hydrolase subunit 1